MNGRTLRTGGGIAGMVGAAAAGALAVGLVSGAFHTSTHAPALPTSTSTNANSNQANGNHDADLQDSDIRDAADTGDR